MSNTISTKLNQEYSHTTKRTTVICIACNMMLCLIKMTGGIVANSSALISDGINSAFDVISGIVVIIGAKIAGKIPDKEHPYGHERFENVAAIILAIILFVTGVFVGHTAIEDLLSGAYRFRELPGKLSIIAALISIAAKEFMFWYTKAVAEKINSISLKAAAWDHRSDVMSTAGALIGIMVSRYGFPAGDLIANLIVCFFIVRTSYKVFKEAISQMTDRSCDDAFLRELRAHILSVNGVLGIDALQVRTFSNRYYVDLEIREDGNISLSNAHKIAEEVHDVIEKQYPIIKHIMVHVNPESKTFDNLLFEEKTKMAKKWYPVIDITTCIECGTCADFCQHGVYDKLKAPTPKVIYPEGCIDHCHGCGDNCPVGAISYVGDDTGWVPPALGKNYSSDFSCGCNSTETESNGKRLLIEYLYLDLHTCDRCIGTDTVLEKTIAALRPALKLAGYEINYKKVEMATAEIARKYCFLSSPTIRVNGNDIFGYIKENNCGCCGEIAGTEVECRVFEWDGKQYEVPTMQVMADAILQAIGKTGRNTDGEYRMPENLKRFYDGKNKKRKSCGCRENCC